jgi:SAM-dependent methyltransferase
MTQWLGYQATKRTLVSTLSGKVLEIGPGKGANLPLLPATVDWTGLEPHDRTRRALTRAAAAGAAGAAAPKKPPVDSASSPAAGAAPADSSGAFAFPSHAGGTGAAGAGGMRQVIAGRAEAIPLPAASFDAVLSTAVLCSVDDLAEALAEIRRVLKPGGRLVFLEHVAAPPGSALLRMQRLIAPINRIVDRGCDPGRDIAPAIHAAFTDVDLNHYTASGLLKIPFIGGTARP